MKDFTLLKYNQLLLALRAAGYRFVTLEDYAAGDREGRVCILRHDVDARPESALRMAIFEQQTDVRASYYFRARSIYDRPEILRDVAVAGHEIGYHYEDLSLARGDAHKAWAHFTDELTHLRRFYPVRTICMHGAPRSPYDGRDLWNHCDYRSLGILCEPYLDLDYNRLLYLTDTGRRWDGYKMAVRDKIPSHQTQWNERGWTFHTTDDIIRWLTNTQPASLPPAIMISTHPQRWAVSHLRWWHERISQPIKNIIKRLIA